MLWSLFKNVGFFALVVALTWGAVQLLNMNDGLLITVGGVEYPLDALQSVILLLVLMALTYLMFKALNFLWALLKFINGDETALSRYFDRNRERKGYQALSEGLMALASGEGRLAMAKASKADRYLRNPGLTDLLTAQAAEMVGDQKKAEEVYKRLLGTDATRFVGVRGLMKQKLSKGDTDTAMKLAERAFAIRPKHEEVQDTLLRLQAQSSDWEGARKTLAAKLKHGALPRDVFKRRDAVLALSKAKDIIAEGKSLEAREAAISANKSSPDLIPAAVMAARSYITDGRKRDAARIVKKAWGLQPHPDLAAVFAEIEPEETPAARVHRFAPLLNVDPKHRETRLLKAELHLAAEEFPDARRALGDLVEDEPDARVLTVMAAIERGEGAPDAVVQGWLAKALTAPRGPQWVCDNCRSVNAEWSPVCGNCGAFDTLTWTAPSQAELSMPAGAGLLPLIVGARQEPEAENLPEVYDASSQDADVIDAPDKSEDRIKEAAK